MKTEPAPVLSDDFRFVWQIMADAILPDPEPDEPNVQPEEGPHVPSDS